MKHLKSEKYRGYIIHIRKDDQNHVGNYFQYSYDQNGINMSKGWIGVYASNKSVVVNLAKDSIDVFNLISYVDNTHRILEPLKEKEK